MRTLAMLLLIGLPLAVAEPPAPVELGSRSWRSG